MFRCPSCGCPTNSMTFCSSCEDLVHGRIREFEILNRMTRDLSSAYDSIAHSQLAWAIPEATREIQRINEIFEETVPSLRALEDATERAQWWMDVPRDDLIAMRESLSNTLAEIANIPALGPFVPSYGELAAVIAGAQDTWQRVIDDPSIGYAFASVQTLLAANQTDVFSKRALDAYHSLLGDWSTVDLAAIQEELRQVPTRQDLYLRLGLEPRLAALDADTVETLLTATRVRPQNLPALVPARVPAGLKLPSPGAHGASQPAEEQQQAPTEERAPEREQEEQEEVEVPVTDYRRLFILESRFRAFIDRVMTEQFGAEWAGHQVHGAIYQKWTGRREEARRGKAPDEAHEGLLNYADLGDLPQIVCQKNNWPHFKPYFHRKEGIQESFNRLMPLRNDIGHCRVLSPTDRILLHIEIRRLLKSTGSWTEED